MTHLAFDRMSAIADARDQDVAIGGADGRHLKECAECREQLRALRQVLALAHVLPRDLEPPPEAWDAIRARVSAGPRITKRWAGERWAAAAAAVILLVGAAIVLPFDFGRSNNLKGAKVASIARAPVAVTAVEQHYTETVKELRQALDEQRPALSAGVAGVVDRSLADIDAAISETRDALVSDPENTTLVDILSSHYERKVDLLQRATELASTS